MGYQISPPAPTFQHGRQKKFEKMTSSPTAPLAVTTLPILGGDVVQSVTSIPIDGADVNPGGVWARTLYWGGWVESARTWGGWVERVQAAPT